MIHPGDYVRTPRFLSVEIKEVFDNPELMHEAGYTETTHFQDPDYEVCGKSLDINHMIFAAARKGGDDR